MRSFVEIDIQYCEICFSGQGMNECISEINSASIVEN